MHSAIQLEEFRRKRAIKRQQARERQQQKTQEELDMAGLSKSVPAIALESTRAETEREKPVQPNEKVFVTSDAIKITASVGAEIDVSMNHTIKAVYYLISFM